MNDIKITVAGATNTGKSTVIQLIERALIEHGIDYNFKEGDQEIRDRGNRFAYIESFDARLEGLKDKLNIEISTVQANRECLIKNKKKGEK